MTKQNSTVLNAVILEIVNNQLRDESQPETKETYDRLIADGYSHDLTMKLIGHVVACEIVDVLKKNRHFDLQSFVDALNALPKLS